MANISRQAWVPFDCASIFALITDVQAYPEFIPWCNSGAVLKTQDNTMFARLTLQYGALKGQFVTQNQHAPPHRVDMHLKEGPFKHLQGSWVLTPVDESASTGKQGCQITFTVDYAFSNRVLAYTFGRLFDGFAHRLIDCFVQRAQALYGNRNTGDTDDKHG